MMTTKSIKHLLGLLIVIAFTTNDLTAQCETWAGKANMEEITDWHTVYRDFIKSKDFAGAEEYWTKVYEAAPAADGKRDFHFTDGAKIYVDKFTKATDDAEKKAHAARVLELYGEAIACYEAGGITSKRGKESALSGLYNAMGYDMYYTLRSPYSKVLETYEKALEYGGDNASYGIVTPMSTVAVYQFEKGNIDKEKALAVYESLSALCSNKADHKYAAYYEQAMGAMKGEYKKIEKDVFDCEYFVEEIKGKFGEDPSGVTLDELKSIVVTLKRQGCTAGQPYLDKFENAYKSKAGAINAAKKAEFEANNPALLAKKCYDSGDYNCALKKYKEAVEQETNPNNKANYHFSIASILFRKMNRFSDARKVALEAAKLRPDWGRPYVLIGDMYSTTARNCGDPWNQSLAVLAAISKWKYGQSKQLDTASAGQVAKKIRTYNKSKPLKEDGFMKGIKPGDKQKVGCWIGETVAVSYR